MKEKWTGERLETFIYSRDTIEHLHRYCIVNSYIENKIVLDIACGEGYGSNIISRKASFVYGVDIDEMTIQNAKKKYLQSNLEYKIGNATNIPFEDNTFDVVVSFETIEHHDKHDEMIAEIKRVLKPEGIIIISTPDKLFYTDKPKYNNKYHVKELYKNEFSNLISKYFSKSQLLTQQYTNGISIIQDESENLELSFFTGDYTSVCQKVIDPMYLILIAGDSDFINQKKSIFDGGEIIEQQIQEQIYNSNSYKVGFFFLKPLRIIKKMLK